MVKTIPQVVVIGAGFGGLSTTRALAKAPVHVVLIDRNNYHLFQPLLYQVATAGLAPEDIAHPIRRIFRNQKNLDFHLADVSQVDLDARQVLTSEGTLPYDFIVLAVGGQTNFYGMEQVKKSAFELKGLNDAIAIRNHLLSQFERAAHEPDAARRQAMLTFVVVGGGPTGVECAGALAELTRMVLSKDYPTFNIQDVRVVLLEAGDHLLSGMPHSLSEAAAETLWSKHVEVRFGNAVMDFDGKQIFLKSGERLPCQTLIWAAGVQAAGLAGTIPAEKGRMGRIKVGPTLQLPQHPEVFVIGDAAYLEDKTGQPLPMVAPVALQQAALAAENIRLILSGKPPHDFTYQDPGTLATIGRNAAVAHLGRWNFTGFLAWVTWLVVHIMQLIGFRNRLVVLINWAWDYLLYDRAIRLILPERQTPGSRCAEPDATPGVAHPSYDMIGKN
jgi:NADH dehydrogenase